MTAKTILADLAKKIVGKTSRTKKENQLFREITQLRLPTTPKSGSKTQKRPTDSSFTEASPSEKLTRKSQDMQRPL